MNACAAAAATNVGTRGNATSDGAEVRNGSDKTSVRTSESRILHVIEPVVSHCFVAESVDRLGAYESTRHTTTTPTGTSNSGTPS